MYENPVSLERAKHRRIFSPLAYSTVLDALVVPIVHREAFRLACWFPTAWRMAKNGPELVIVRALTKDRSANFANRELVMLPLVLQAYPFLLDRANTKDSNLAVLYDDSIAEEPNDVGAPVLMPNGNFSRGAEFRLRALRAYARYLPATEAMSHMLHRMDLLEPWPLSFEVGGKKIGFDDLFVVRPAAFDTGTFSPVVARFGPDAASFLSCHRLSLFRAGPQLAAARAAAGEISTEQEAPGFADLDHVVRAAQ
jgi:hypothetical protein